MATAIGSYAHAVTLESALAVALTFRGAEVHALLCDGTMTACAECEASLYPNVQRFVEHGPSRDLCRDCRWPAENVYKTLGLKIHRMSDWLTRAAGRSQAHCRCASVRPDRALQLRRLNIGEHAHAGRCGFSPPVARHRAAREPVLRRYLNPRC
jgi:hypothetical protein